MLMVFIITIDMFNPGQAGKIPGNSIFIFVKHRKTMFQINPPVFPSERLHPTPRVPLFVELSPAGSVAFSEILLLLKFF
jgi:hypothetical protein